MEQDRHGMATAGGSGLPIVMVAGGRREVGARAAGPAPMTPDALVERVLDCVPQPIWVVDAVGRIMFANPAAVSMLGYDDVEQLRGAHGLLSLHHRRGDGTAFPVAECALLRPRETGEAEHGEHEWFTRHDGSMFPVAWWSAPIEMTAGRGAILALTDITERLAGRQAVRDRDAAEVRGAESRSAQRRMLEATTATRRSVARDLHDGAQQQLVNLLITLALARAALGGSPDTEALLDEASEEAQAAIDELRELVVGIHPAALATRGLGAAVEALAARTQLPIMVTDTLARRLPDEVETTAYFAIAEALTNALEHAGASRVDVCLRLVGDRLEAEVRDDGVGGACATADGTGLAGLADRLGALGGELVVDSPDGAGTAMLARIPLDAGSA